MASPSRTACFFTFSDAVSHPRSQTTVSPANAHLLLINSRSTWAQQHQGPISGALFFLHVLWNFLMSVGSLFCSQKLISPRLTNLRLRCQKCARGALLLGSRCSDWLFFCPLITEFDVIQRSWTCLGGGDVVFAMKLEQFDGHS